MLPWRLMSPSISNFRNKMHVQENALTIAQNRSIDVAEESTHLRHSVHLRKQELVLLRQSRRESRLQVRHERTHQVQRLAAQRKVLRRYGLKICGRVDGARPEHQLRRPGVEHLTFGGAFNGVGAEGYLES